MIDIENIEFASALAYGDHYASMDIVSSVYPGWIGTVQAWTFKRWLSDQPLRIRVLAVSESAADSIRLLDEYARWRGEKPRGYES